MRAKDAVGRYGEDVAAAFVARAGWTVLARNWRCPEGELDIVALDGDEVVAVEVKTRRSTTYGTLPRRSPTASSPGCAG
ncbi:YraN family protein [Cellulomonas phragmiteti]|uniref:YraN family protein n=1 Tax=Cellulomonas phragmiteti TaxID=478780 RepID=UPI003643C27F